MGWAGYLQYLNYYNKEEQHIMSKQSTIESLVLKSMWTVIGESIKSADITECNLIQSKLEDLLSEAKQRTATLEILGKEDGLQYEGKDKVECGKCDNTFQPGSKYSTTCDCCCEESKVELCIDCLMKCAKCNKTLCGSCTYVCSGRGCKDGFCDDCLSDQCICCGKYYCNRASLDRYRQCTMHWAGEDAEGEVCFSCMETH